MKPDIVTCMANKHDTPFICKVLSHLSPVHLSQHEMLDVFEEQEKNMNHIIYIAKLVSTYEIVGVATVFFERKFIHRGGRVAHIEDVVVLPEYRDCGVGARLIGECIDTSRRLGCYKIILNCKQENVGFYEQLGFKKHEVQMRYDI